VIVIHGRNSNLLGDQAGVVAATAGTGPNPCRETLPVDLDDIAEPFQGHINWESCASFGEAARWIPAASPPDGLRCGI
jgi:hypothetical protein